MTSIDADSQRHQRGNLGMTRRDLRAKESARSISDDGLPGIYRREDQPTSTLKRKSLGRIVVFKVIVVATSS